MGTGCRYWMVALYIYGYQEVNNYVTMCRNIIQCSKCHKTPPIPIVLNQARSHNEANEAVASPKISKKNLPQMKNS